MKLPDLDTHSRDRSTLGKAEENSTRSGCGTDDVESKREWILRLEWCMQLEGSVEFREGEVWRWGCGCGCVESGMRKVDRLEISVYRYLRRLVGAGVEVA